MNLMNNEIEFPEKEFVKVATTAEKIIEEIELPELKDFGFIKTGFADLDKVNGGFQMGEMIVIASTGAIGKTQFMVNLALNISQQNKVGFISLDDSAQALTTRMLACLSEIPLSKLFKSNLSGDEILLLKKHKVELEKREIIFNDNAIHSVSYLIEQCRKMVVENGVKIIFFETLQSTEENNFKNTIENDLQLLCGELKKIAIELEICVVIASQIAFQLDDNKIFRPSIFQLKNETQQYADKVILLYRPKFYDLDNTINKRLKNSFELLLRKNKMGSLATIELFVNDAVTTFSDTNDYTKDYFFY